jgi:gliding motility-associated-like protein
MKRIIFSGLLILSFILRSSAQCVPCAATTFNIDLSASIDTVVSIQSNRNGDCCTGTNCIRFNIIINPASSYVNFSVANPAPAGSAYYQINCGPQVSIGTPVCVVGLTNVCISYCKPGNDAPIYTITAAGTLQGSPDITIREGCSGKIGVSGLILSTINWTSIFPGAPGAYNSYLSCLAACDSTIVHPQPGSPPYIDYQVSGNRICGPIEYDTIRVYTQPQMTVSITPLNPMVCPGGNTNLTLTATPSGGDAPYSFNWNTGQTTPSIIVNAAGTYTVTVSDSNSNCAAVSQPVTVTALPVPPAPAITTNSPLCAGSTLNLTASSAAGATYSWTGPNGFTSNQQNPVIPNVNVNNAGVYSVTATLNGCPGATSTTQVTVNPIPASPVASNNSPVCEGSTLNLSATTIAGAVYNWTGPNGFTASTQNISVSNVTSANAGTYSVTATVNGCSSPAATTTVVINPLPATPTISSNSPVCSGTTISLNAASHAGATYSWTGPNGFSSTLQNPSIPNAAANNAGTYSVTAILNGCAGSTAHTVVVVNQSPLAPVAGSNSPLCEGTTLNLTSSPTANAIYNWSGPNGFSSTLQNPVITNITTAAAGLYSVTATVNGCTGPAGTIMITVNVIPSAPVAAGNSPLCAGNDLILTAGTMTGATYAWSGPNGFSSSLQNPVITNATTAHSGIYSLTVTVNGCTSNPSSVNVIVNPVPTAPVLSNNSPVCTGNTILLNANAIAGAIYNWTGPNGFTSSLQNPSITNATISNAGVYNASVTVNGCSSANAAIQVNINPTPEAPVATNNGALCEGSILNLSASVITGATYNWTGPNGFTASTQHCTVPNVTFANAGQYLVSATINGCTSLAGMTNVVIDQPPVANAGNDQTVCITHSVIPLHGSISGGNGTGIWSTSGTGIFSPSNTALNAAYLPGASDTTEGFVLLTLLSTNNGACPPGSSAITITFAPAPIANAGNNTSICADDKVFLNGNISNAAGGTWSSSGSGSFIPSNTSLNAIYIPGSSDITKGNVTLTLTTTGNGICSAVSGSILLTIHPLPFVNAGADKYIIEKTSVILTPAVNGSGLQYVWSPALYLDKDTVLNPVCQPLADIIYTLTVTDNRGCSSKDDIAIKVLKIPEIPNVFTPNGDGINDTWQIKHLVSYPGCTVEVYTRYGQLIFQSTGYGNPWNGTANGKPVPAATYYYIINPKNGLKPMSGFVDIVR